MKLTGRIIVVLTTVCLIMTLIPSVFADNLSAVLAQISWEDVDETVYATGAVNVRTGPSTDFERLSTLSYGQSVRRTGIGSNGWSRVVYQGEEAYVYSAHLSKVRPGSSGTGVDYADLERQIAIAKGLKAADYTAQSWQAVREALEQGEAARKSSKQSVVDAAELTLCNAIAGLVSMDYAGLWAILLEADALNETDGVYDLWAELVEAVNAGKALLNSGDQAAVDAGTAKIYAKLAEVREYLEEASKPQIITKEVEVEVPPKDDFCNIAMHRTWPVLFFVSLILNVALIAVMIGILRKKEKQADDTPLIDYDIDDDFDA